MYEGTGGQKGVDDISEHECLDIENEAKQQISDEEAREIIK